MFWALIMLFLQAKTSFWGTWRMMKIIKSILLIPIFFQVSGRRFGSFTWYLPPLWSLGTYFWQWKILSLFHASRSLSFFPKGNSLICCTISVYCSNSLSICYNHLSQNQTFVVIKAPRACNIEVPDPDEVVSVDGLWFEYLYNALVYDWLVSC